MPNQSDSDRVSAYLAKHANWRDPLEIARNVILDSGLDESIKWGGPAYSLNGRVLIGLAAFTRHCAIWFHHGVFLSDTEGKLLQAQSATRGMRQWRIEADDKVPRGILRKYVKETINNEKAGKRIVPARKKSAPHAAELPAELAGELARNARLSVAFETLTPGKQREYVEHVTSAKRAATRESRVAKLIPLVLAGKGLHDKYR